MRLGVAASVAATVLPSRVLPAVRGLGMRLQPALPLPQELCSPATDAAAGAATSHDPVGVPPALHAPR